MRSLRQQSWYQRNKERVLAQQREYLARPDVKERRKIWNKEWAAKNPDKVKEIRARFKPKERAKSRHHYLRKAYGITTAQFDALVESQCGRCAICRRTDPGAPGSWRVDHDHTTGSIRGLLCHPCNVLLGCAADNVDTLRSAIAYLQKNDMEEVANA